MSHSLEQLYGPQLRGPLLIDTGSSNAQWAGILTVASGDATATKSTVLVNSDSVILLSTRTKTSQASGTHRPIEVKSIKSGSYFTVGTDDGVAVTRNEYVHWMLFKAS